MPDGTDNYMDGNETDLWDLTFAQLPSSYGNESDLMDGVPKNLPISAMAADPAVVMAGGLLPSESNVTSFLPVRDSLAVVIPITIIYVIILVVGLVGNVVTCIVIVRSRYLHTATNYYLFSLAISDILLLLSGLPVEMHSMWQRYPDIFGEGFCIGRGLAAETSANATVLTITAFTIERYLAICRPFMIQKWNNKLSRVVRQIIFIWLLSFTLAIPQAIQLGVVDRPVGMYADGTAVFAPMCTVKKTLVEYSFEIASLVFFVAPMVLITALYILIGLTLRNASHVKEGKLRLRKSMSSNKREVGQQRVLKMLVAVVVAFFFCWAPFHAQRLIWKWTSEAELSRKEIQRLYEIATYTSGVLYYVATCVNPVLYHTMSLKFRHAFKDTMSGCMGAREAQRRRQGYRSTQSTSCSSRSQGLILTDITLTISSSQNGSTKCQFHPHVCGRMVSV